MSVKQEEIRSGVSRLFQEIEDLKGARYQLSGALMEEKCLRYEGKNVEHIIEFNEVLPVPMCREFVNRTVKQASGLVAVFTKKSENEYQYILGSSTQNVRDFAQNMNQQLHGKGGGSPQMIQGTVSATHEEISVYFFKG